MNEFFNLNEDEVEKAIQSLENILFLKYIEKKLYKNNKDDFLSDDKYSKYIVTRRDDEYDNYNSIFISPISILFLDAIFCNDYEIIDFDSYEKEDLEELYYNFKVDESYRLYGEEAFDDLGQSYAILVLQTDAIEKALKIADGNKTILDKIYKLASKITVDASDLQDSAAINLKDYQVEILLSNYSLYDIETNACECLELELYCREVVYGKDKDRN